MNTPREYIDYAVGRYEYAVWFTEHCAPRIGEDEPAATAERNGYRPACLWWAARWVNQVRTLLQPVVRAVHGEQPAG